MLHDRGPGSLLGLALLLAGLQFVTGCPASNELAVDLQTDFVPGVEFDAIEASLDGARPRVVAVTSDDRYDRPRRILERTGVARGRRVVGVTLLRGETRVASRRVEVAFEDSYLLNVVMTRDCREVSCPATGATECVGRRCVPPECSELGQPGCPDPACASDGDCAASVACAVGRCVAGACLEVPRESGCGATELCVPGTGCVPRPETDAGTVDAGALDAGGCADCGECARCSAGRCVAVADGDACTMGRCVDGACCTGCVDGAGRCQTGDAAGACGGGGAVCQSCGECQACAGGSCAITPGAECGGTTSEGFAAGRCMDVGTCCTGCLVADGTCYPGDGIVAMSRCGFGGHQCNAGCNCMPSPAPDVGGTCDYNSGDCARPAFFTAGGGGAVLFSDLCTRTDSVTTACNGAGRPDFIFELPAADTWDIRAPEGYVVIPLDPSGCASSAPTCGTTAVHTGATVARFAVERAGPIACGRAYVYAYPR